MPSLGGHASADHEPHVRHKSSTVTAAHPTAQLAHPPRLAAEPAGPAPLTTMVLCFA
jgi:hypothetical protein